MLHITLGRLRRRWPARIGVTTSAPRLLVAIAPASEPILARCHGEWPWRGTRFRKPFAGRF